MFSEKKLVFFANYTISNCIIKKITIKPFKRSKQQQEALVYPTLIPKKRFI